MTAAPHHPAPVPTDAPREAPAGTARLSLDPTICRGHGICAALAPGLIALDDWGYPIITAQPRTSAQRADARRAVDLCPALALRLRRS